MAEERDEAVEQYRQTLIEAWVETRMEFDRTLLNLSVGGIGLMVTLLTAVRVPSAWVWLPYGFTIAAFLYAIRVALAIFRGNAGYLERAANDPATERDPALGRLDRHLGRAFWAGVLGAILSASSVAIVSHFTPG